MSSPLRRRALTAGLALGAILVAGAATTASAMASPSVRSGATAVNPAATRTHSCAQSLYVREQPLGRAIGTLYYGDTFDVERTDASGQWSYGMAYGHVNQHGWVESSWLC